MTKNQKAKSKSFILTYFVIVVAITTMVIQGFSHFEKRYLELELQGHMRTGYEFVTYIKESINARLENMKKIHEKTTVSEMFESNPGYLKALVIGTLQPAHLFGNDVWMVDQDLNFIYDGSKDTEYDFSKKVNLIEHSMKDSHYGGYGLDKIAERIKQGTDGMPEEKLYYLWNDNHGNMKEWAVWAIIPASKSSFSGDSNKYWAVVFTIKDSFVFDHYREIQFFTYLSVGIFLFMLWTSSLFMVIVYSKSV